MKRSALQNKRVAVLRMAFRARKVFRTFREKRDPAHESCIGMKATQRPLHSDVLSKEFSFQQSRRFTTFGSATFQLF